MRLDLVQLYILIFLHQTATTRVLSIKNDGCISLYSYIKPQQFRSQVAAHLAVYPYIPTSNRNIDDSLVTAATAVYPYIPTSNRNLTSVVPVSGVLYILIFLHQTATAAGVRVGCHCCISLYSYIKPQRGKSGAGRNSAVYPYIPTSNRNHERERAEAVALYILIFLHQTATSEREVFVCFRCISLYSYIKPQLNLWKLLCTKGNTLYPRNKKRKRRSIFHCKVTKKVPIV